MAWRTCKSIRGERRSALAAHPVLVCGTTAASRPAPGVNAGLTISAALDSRFSVAYAGAEFLSVYLVRAVNTGPQSDTFRFSATGGGSGMNMQDAYWELPTVSIRPGASLSSTLHAATGRAGSLGDGRAVHDQRCQHHGAGGDREHQRQFHCRRDKALDMRIALGRTPRCLARREPDIDSRLVWQQYDHSGTDAHHHARAQRDRLPASVTLAAGEDAPLHSWQQWAAAYCRQ